HIQLLVLKGQHLGDNRQGNTFERGAHTATLHGVPWKEQSAMDQRQEFVMAQLAGEIPFAELCRRYQVSRKTGYKWVRRFLDGGLPALIGRSRAPHSHPHAVDSAGIDAIIALKKRYPSWGPKKLKARLERDAPQVGWP